MRQICCRVLCALLVGVPTLATGRTVAVRRELPQSRDLVPKLVAQIGHTSFVWSVAFSPDGTKVLTGSWDNTARLWDVSTGALVRAFEGHSEWVYSVAFSPDGTKVLTGSDDKTAWLWDASTGALVRAFEGHSEGVYSVAFSPDGTKVLTGSGDGTARLWDVATGALVRAFEGHPREVQSVAFSPDGTKVLTGSKDETARLWDVSTGALVRAFEGHSHEVLSVAFSPEGTRVLTGSRDGTSRLWDVATGALVCAFEGHSDLVQSVAFSPDGTRVLTGSNDRTARLWDASTGALVRAFEGHSLGVLSVAFSPDGTRVLTGSWDNTARQWDASTGALVRAFNGHSRWVPSVAFSPDGTKVLTGSADQTARLWDASTGALVCAFEGHSEPVQSVAFSPDGTKVLTGSWDKTARLWDASTGALVRAFEGHSDDLISVAFSPDGTKVLTWSFYDAARQWDASTGALVCSFEGRSSAVESVAYSPDGTKALTGSNDGIARLRDASTGALVHSFAGHSGSVWDVAFSPDGTKVLTGGNDSTTRVWSVESGRELCSLIAFDDGTWAVTDPEGRFDASNGGDVEGLHWVIGDEPIALSQLKDRYYEPGLLRKRFKGVRLRPVESFANVKLAPEVRATPVAPTATKLALTLTNRGGGIGRVRVLVNGKEIAADARGPKPDLAAPSAFLAVDLAGAPVIAGKPNTIEVIAWNADGTLSSRGVKVLWTPEGTAREVKPELYAVVVGVSDYASDTLDLRFAAKDAADFATALDAGAKTLFGADRVHISLLTTAPGAVAPTKENIARAFEAARAARPEDIFVVYLAGHGTAIAGSDTYCYLTRDAKGFSELADPAIRSLTAVTDSELVEWIKKVPALKQVMVLDTCAAGAASAKLTEQRDVTGDQVRAIDRLKDRTGFFVLMGSAADAVSYEATQFGQGLLTYSLLKAMKGASLRDGRFADVMTLFGYAADEVPELARNVGGIQRPLVASPRGSSFDIGQFGEAEKRRVPLASPRPMVLRPSFLNARGRDVLELSVAVRRELAEQTRALVRGADVAGVVYVDGEELPGAVVPSGIYTVEGETVRVNLVLSKDGKEVEIKVIGTKADIAAKVVAAINALVARLG
jgi:WD40 repeat protein